MKMQFANINSCEYIVEFHDVHLYYNNEDDEQMEYLFNFNKTSSNAINKKYLLPINTKSFVQFVANCLEYPGEKLSKSDFEISIIQLIDKYNQNYNCDVMNLVNTKIGSLILHHIQYKDFVNLKSIEKQFGFGNKFSKTVDSQFFNSQICYLLIMINNLLSLNKKPLVNFVNKNYKIKKTKETCITDIKTENFDYLDFIFDYWS